MTSKIKKVKLYHPELFNADGVHFSDLLVQISQKDTNDRIIDLTDNKLILEARMENDVWILSLQDLKKDELPKIADSANGTDERNLDIPEGKMLSYKNVFIYSGETNTLACCPLYGCPQVGKLKFCLEKFLKAEYGNDASLRVNLVFNNNLIEKLRRCNTITVAEFSSLDYDGETIPEARLNLYREYLAGHNLEKVTKIKGRRGENIRRLLMPIIDDFISHREDDSIPISIKMKIDGEDVNFEKYYKIYEIKVKMDEENEKYVDYASLAKELKAVISRYTQEETQQ